MPFKTPDRVKAVTSTTGTGAFTLGGAKTSYRAFSDALSDGDTCPYSIVDPATGDFETGIGTYTASSDSLSRDTVLTSSNGGAKVAFGAGTKVIGVTAVGARSVQLASAPTQGQRIHYDGGEWTPRTDVYDVRDFGATGDGVTDDTAAIQAAIDAAEAAGGGLVSINAPGTYALGAVAAPAFSTNPRCGLLVDDANVAIYLGDGVILEWLDNQINDTDGRADLILVKSSAAGTFRLFGAGRLTGNTAGQTNWTGGYTQLGSCGLRAETSTADGGAKGAECRIDGIQFDDFFGDPFAVRDFDRIRIGEIYGFDCGEGFFAGRSTDVQAEKIIYADDSDVAVGDAVEFPNCDRVQVGKIIVTASNNGEGAGLDTTDAKVVQVDQFLVDGWAGFGGIPGSSDVSLTIGLMVCRNIDASKGIVGQRAGQVHVETLVVLECERTVDLEGDASDPIGTIGTFIYTPPATGGSGLAISGDRTWSIGRVDIDGANQRGILVIEDFGGGDPSLYIGGGRVVNSAEDSVRIIGNGDGSTFAPTVQLVGVDLGGAGGEIIKEHTVDASAANVKLINSPTPFANADRPAALAEGTVIYNSDDGNLNIYDGTNWITPDGTTT